MSHDPHHGDPRRESHERFWLPLVVPAAIILFAILTIYGLSRIYLELNTWHYKDVHMATPLAIGIALVILIIAAILASRPVPAAAIVTIALLAASGLTGGAIWAAVHPDSEVTVVTPVPTGGQTGTPVGPGGVTVTLDDDPAFAITDQPATGTAGEVTFHVENVGTVPHNFNIVKTDLAPDALPTNADTFQVDESQLTILEKSSDLDAGATEDVKVTLDAGKYVIFCNVPAHYASGMHAAFTIQ